MTNPYGGGDADGRPHGQPPNTPPPQQQGYPQQGYQQPGYPPYPQAQGAPVPPAEPSEVTTSFWLWIADVVVGLIGAAIAFTHLSTVIDEILGASGAGGRNPQIVVSVVKASIIVGVVVSVVVVLLHVLFAVFMRRGRNWARIVLTVLGGLGVLSTVIGLFGTATVAVNGHQIATRTGLSTVISIVQALIIIAAIVMFFRPAANAYFAAHKR